jgi:hypothetical protein
MTITELSVLVAELKRKREVVAELEKREAACNPVLASGIALMDELTALQSRFDVDVVNTITILLSAAETLARIAGMPCAKKRFVMSGARAGRWEDCGYCAPDLARAAIEGMENGWTPM